MANVPPPLFTRITGSVPAWPRNGTFGSRRAAGTPEARSGPEGAADSVISLPPRFNVHIETGRPRRAAKAASARGQGGVGAFEQTPDDHLNLRPGSDDPGVNEFPAR